ncbi:MAG: hypothetical protein Q9205_003593 [Flavoplaca limonia]
MGEAAQQHKKHSNVDTARLKSNQEHGANQGALQNMYDWSQSVSLAVENAELAQQRASSGHSMEYHGAATGANSVPPPIRITPKSRPSQCSEISSSQHGLVLQSRRMRNAKSDQVLDRSEERGKDPNDGDQVDDGNGDENEKEDDEDGGEGDEEDDNSTKSQPSSTTSTISGLSLPNEGYILEIVRRSKRWTPAMLELPKQRTLRCETDWKNQKLKSEILRAARKAEEYYEISKQKQEQTVQLHEQTIRSHRETMEHHEKAEQQVKRTEALVIKLNDGILSQGVGRD